MNRPVKIIFAALLFASTATSDPAKRALTVLDFRAELALSESQGSQIQQQLGNLRTRLKAFQEQRHQLQKDCEKLLKDSAPLPEIKAKLAQLSAVNVDAQMADITAARNIQGILTPTQFARWQELQAQKRP